MPVNESNRIRFFRKKQGLTVAELARKANISEISIKKYESGSRFPKVETMSKIADALNVKLGDLYKNDNDFQITPDFKMPSAGMIKIELEHDSTFVDAVEFQKSFNNIVQKTCPNLISHILDNVYKLNIKGQDKLLEYVKDLAKIPEYQRTEKQEE